LIKVDPLDRNTAFEIELDFYDVESSAPFAEYLGANPPDGDPIIEVRRSATELNQTKSFQQDQLELGDDDLAAVTYPQGGESLYLVVYALSYGLYEYTPIFSDARYLGYMDYNF
jgi:hypothetical protein